nr:glycosyltransferase family 4 protein [Planctomycetota bacterium]
GTQVNQAIYDTERAGMHAANKIIAVSNYTKNMLVRHYGVAPAQIQVVHNGVDFVDSSGTAAMPPKEGPMVLFLGRITMQKGPDYFLAAAKRVLEVISNVTFVMAGEGDMLPRMIERAAALGIDHEVLFTRFLRAEQVARMFRMADLYVMPSVSEPFGIAPLEALSHDVPVIISKQSGVSEVLTHVLKVDFWDIDQMANKMIAVLKHAPLRDTLRACGRNEARGLRWEDAAAAVEHIYSQVLTEARYK